MTTWMIFPDHASGNYWLAMCECDGDTIKAEGREGGWVPNGITEPLSYASPEIVWLRPYY